PRMNLAMFRAVFCCLFMGFACLVVDLGSDPTAFRVMHGYSWPHNPSAAFCGVLGGKEVRLSGLAAQNALRASQAVREMRVMLKAIA
ncbi:MAG: hypothetical protein ACRC9E_09935, partial [Plesiomonas shigelloides]